MNVKLFIYKCIRRLIIYCYYIYYRKPIIVFESVPNLSDNTKAVFDEMIRRGLNSKYHFIWIAWNDNERKLENKNCEVIDFDKKGIKHEAKIHTIERKAKCIICCNRFIKPYNNNCKSFYLGHGSPIKYTKSYYNMPLAIDYCFAASKNLINIVADQRNIPTNKVVALGYPRVDELTKEKINISKYLKHKYEKVIIWYPTFRQHKKANALTNSLIAIPIIHNEDLAKELNNYLVELNVAIVVKPHFAQDTTFINNLNLSNIIFIDDEFYSKNCISSYKFLMSCDALLSDYSSVYYDYTLCDKPIGVIWEDIEEYRTNPGFSVNLDYNLKGAEKIYTLDELKDFISRVANGVDLLKNERREIRDFANYSTDGKNTKRVTDFIVEKAKL